MMTPKEVAEKLPRQYDNFGVKSQIIAGAYGGGWRESNCRNHILPWMKQDPETRKSFAFKSSTVEKTTGARQLLRDVEEYLGLEPSKTTQGSSRRGRGHVLVIQPSNEWITTPLRTSLLTFILKVGRSYQGQGVKEFLFARADTGVYYWAALNRPTSILRRNIDTVFKEPGQGLPAMEERTWEQVGAYGGGIGIIESRLTGANGQINLNNLPSNRKEVLYEWALANGVAVTAWMYKPQIIQLIREHRGQ